MFLVSTALPLLCHKQLQFIERQKRVTNYKEWFLEKPQRMKFVYLNYYKTIKHD